jgi:hypothetical protein
MNLINKILDNKVKMLDKYIYLRLAYYRSGAHIGIWNEILGLVKDAIIIIGVFKLPIAFSITIAVIASLAYLIFRIVLGHIDLQKGWMTREMTINNQYNKEIQEILHNGRDKNVRKD